MELKIWPERRLQVRFLFFVYGRMSDDLSKYVKKNLFNSLVAASFCFFFCLLQILYYTQMHGMSRLDRGTFPLVANSLLSSSGNSSCCVGCLCEAGRYFCSSCADPILISGVGTPLVSTAVYWSWEARGLLSCSSAAMRTLQTWLRDPFPHHLPPAPPHTLFTCLQRACYDDWLRGRGKLIHHVAAPGLLANEWGAQQSQAELDSTHPSNYPHATSPTSQSEGWSWAACGGGLELMRRGRLKVEDQRHKLREITMRNPQHCGFAISRAGCVGRWLITGR